MRILLAASASYDPPKGGSTRSNLVWLRAMASSGHDCLVLAGGDADRETTRDGLRIRTIAEFPRNAHRIREAVAEFDPDFVLVSSEDLSHSLLREAHAAARHRLVYLAHTPQWFPFGPEAWHKDEAASRLLADALAIVAIGHSTAGYIAEHLGRPAVVVPPAIYGTPPWPAYDNFAAQTALLINPCTAKGLPILLELAPRFPAVRFLALKGWGTTAQDIAAMRQHPNIEILDTVPSIDEVFARTSVLLAPSLWYEGFGLVVTEALIRGVPVLASDHGGLSEAAASSRFRLPVSPITHWQSTYDDTGMPVAEVAPQPVVAWQNALAELLGNEKLYASERAAGLEAARSFAEHLSPHDLETLLAGLKPRPLRIHLVHNSTYYPSTGGGDKSNRILVKALTEQGHEVQVFTRLEQFGPEAEAAFMADLAEREVATMPWQTFGLSYELGGARVHVVTRETNLRAALQQDLAGYAPDVILCSTDDPAHLFYETALKQEGARVVYLVRATIALPFGPDASTVSAERTARLAEADAVVGVSEYVARYCREHGNLPEALHVPISLGDDPHPPHVGSYDNPYVTLVNPSAVKGLPVLLGLADALPEVRFAAVPSWGTTEADYAAMRARPNITLLERADDITEILRQTRVTLVPSLWAEARSRMVVESLSRGVPVLASDVGGLREAMCGVDHVLPVNPIVRYESKVSDQMVPEADVPPQDLGPWVATLRHLLADRATWQALSDTGRAAAVAYLESLSVKPLERVIRKSLAARRHRKAISIEYLSPVKRRLLALRLEQLKRERASKVFPITRGAGTRVYLMPWAGAGAQSWDFLPDHVGFVWVPAQLPSHESFAELIPAIVAQMATDEPYLIAGHSMGGGLAFEVARELRRQGKPLPKGLLLSSCTAPAVRKARAYSPASEDPVELDRAMFSAHVYQTEPPLDVPITVLRGDEEIRVAEWREETTASFHWAALPGDHFWLKEQPNAFIEALRGLNGIL